jgi:predicted aminopeptidase
MPTRTAVLQRHASLPHRSLGTLGKVPVLLCLVWLSGCADTGYLLQSASGHLKLIQASRAIDVWLDDVSVPERLKQRLQLAREMRRFAVTDLHLPDNASYQRYAQLDRRAVVWNVVAAPTYSLTLKTWCFPVTGCVGYRGYFDEADAKAEAARLRMQGLEASVYGVPAYSTLGWTNWLGGDPLLSTFIHYPQGELARMIFHELAHQVLYVPDDTAFNESFATAVERLGSSTWLAQQKDPAVASEYILLDTRRQAFRALAARTRQQLMAAYVLPTEGATTTAIPPVHEPVPEQQQTRKAAIYADFRSDYAQLRACWGGDSRYDAWVANANNAAFGALAAYDDWVGAFEALFRHEAGDWEAFYAATRRLAQLPRPQRTEQLRRLQSTVERSAPLVPGCDTEALRLHGVARARE